MYSRRRSLPPLSNPNNDHGWNYRLADQPIGGLIDLPLHAGEGDGCFKEILTIIQVQHRVAPSGIFGIVVARRQPNAQESRVAKDTAVKFVQTQVSGRGLSANDAGQVRQRLSVC